MAHMTPAEIPMHGPGAKAESAVFTALRDQLGDDYFVYSRLEYIDDKKYTQGEADFLVLHRQKGMLFIECKGGGVRRTGSGHWKRQHYGKWEPMHESPMEQAERTKYALIDKLEPRLKRILPAFRHFPFLHGHAVSFPFATVDELNLPLDEPRALIIDANDLDNIEAKLNSIFKLWQTKAGFKPTVLEKWQFDKFRKKVLHPKLHIADSISGRIKAESRVMVKLTRDQVYAIEGLLYNNRIKISGGAGTGKTVLALEAAHRLSPGNETVLILCYNKALRNHLEERTAADTDITVNSFSALSAHAYFELGKSQVPVPAAKTEQEQFWNTEAPLVLLEALEAELIPKYDAIVVDEGQDFAANWWEILETMLKPNGKLFAFYDPHQEIFSRSEALPPWPEYRLSKNFRNTKEITKCLNQLVAVNMQSPENAPDGDPPTVIQHKTAAQDLKELNRLIEHLLTKDGILPDQITILTPHTKKHSSLAGITSLAGIALSDSPDNRAGQLLHTTIGAFKGLESDILFLLDIDPIDPRCDLNARYVAASRARHRLYVFANGDWTR